MDSRTLAATAAFFVFAASAADAGGVFYFEATLKGAHETPPITTAAKGYLDAAIDTDSRLFSYKITCGGLTGPATDADFQDPAVGGADAIVKAPVNGCGAPISGTAQLTKEQITDLMAGKWSLNLHTSTHPDGEISGKLSRTDR